MSESSAPAPTAPAESHLVAGERVVIDLGGLEALLALLRERGHRVVGPTVRDGAIVFGDIATLEDLPRGWTDEQAPGHYRLRRRDDEALFGYAVGPQSLKPFLFAPRLRLVQLRRRAGSFEVAGERPAPPRLAVLGARACDLTAMSVQDRVFVGGPVPEEDYAGRRAALFVVAVQCGVASQTCFCASVGSGPRADGGFDLALTELVGAQHRFVVEIGSARGAEVAAALPSHKATEADERAAAAVSARTAAQLKRSVDTVGIKELLYRSAEHPQLDDIASRCVSCGNCTLVCPTCFCSTIEDASNLSGDTAERVRRWDSCFTLDHSYVHGGSVRGSVRARYRQWMTHKFASWIDQFGSSGCVGCGRCVTWCPVGIDITAELATIRGTDQQATP